MMMIVIDTNIIFAILGRIDSKYADAVLSGNHEIFCSTFLFVELFKHKERILKKSKLNEDDLLLQLHVILNSIKIVPVREVSTASYYKAFRICRHVDVKDIDFIALALEKKAMLWTKDKPIITAIQQSGIIELFTPQPF